MLNDLLIIHEQVMNNTPMTFLRYLHSKVNWESQAICILGSRGAGKTTLMCQQLLKAYKTPNHALYISADNIHVSSKGLFKIAQEFFDHGGNAIFIDEAHKYPNWSMEIKNIIDTYKNKKIIFSASSLLDLKKSKYDLSRRVIYYELKGLSFREYLNFSVDETYKPFTLKDIIGNHSEITNIINTENILKHFGQYLKTGYYPYFIEGKDDYLLKLNNVIEKVIYEDIASVYQLKNNSLTLLKKLLWLIATSKGLKPNIEKISKNLNTTRIAIYNGFEYLNQAELIKSIFVEATGMKLIRKPEKIFLENTNLTYALSSNFSIANFIGNIREIFFVNQVSNRHTIKLHDSADFVIDGEFVFEVGGKSKNGKQIKNIEKSYLAVDQISLGIGNRIPLYLFGFLY